jgi:hypothetical protein
MDMVLYNQRRRWLRGAAMRDAGGGGQLETLFTHRDLVVRHLVHVSAEP